MRLHNVLFDFDGTLANTLPLTVHAMKKVFKRFDSRTVTTDEVIAMFGPPEEKMISMNLTNQADVAEAVEFYFVIYEKQHDAYVEKNLEIFKLLHLLRDRNINIGLITGKARRSYLISEKKLGFGGKFDSIITGDDVSVAKPDPEGINRTLKKFDALPEESIYIGDANGDTLAGKAAGIHTAAVQWLEMAQSSEFPAKPEFYWTKVEQFIAMLNNEIE
ncbi:HAD family hydrolase [Sporolactobacillus terrae]|uniref:HAD family hydrolase n=1 Tax=Sporolactobacillus terrae TaxID=269673 RepID=UPI00048DBF24|nr:HAD family hydrolase [Sporolactobacillus terrae]